MPVVGQEDPRGQQEAVFVTHAREARGQPTEIVFSQNAPWPPHIAGDEEIAVREHQTPQAGHAAILPMCVAEYNKSRRPTEQVCATGYHWPMVFPS